MLRAFIRNAHEHWDSVSHSDRLLDALNKPVTLKTYVPDRPGHDRRYLLDSSKIRQELSWEPEIDFESGIKETIHWYTENHAWWQELRQKEENQAVQEDAWQKERGN